jgi:hypothetical protein
LFVTRDDAAAVLDFYENKMTTATWQVHRGTSAVSGYSDAEGRKFRVDPEKRGAQTRTRVTFEDDGRK